MHTKLEFLNTMHLDIFGSGLTLFSFIGFILLTSETEWGHDGKWSVLSEVWLNAN